MDFKIFLTVFSFLHTVTFVSNASTSFRFGQFYPTQGTANPLESQSRACGPIRDVIKRNSARFRRVLVRNVNPEVEFTNDDSRYMTSRSKSKLDVLASRARSAWGNSYGIQVIRSWTDRIDSNNLLSLHYEGRSLLIRFKNGDNNRLALLAGLAVQSGFDWVHYGNPVYITVSVIPDVCQTKLDMALVIDSSGSVGYSNFLKFQDFIRKLIDFFNIGKNETHIALLSYSQEVFKVFNLVQYINKIDMKNAVGKMHYEGSITATGDALHVMRTWAFGKGNGIREDKAIPKVGILLTDGYSNIGRSVYQVSSEVHNSGISMFVVGVTSNVRIGELNAIASDPDNKHVFRLNDFTDLNGFVERLSAVSCDEGATVSKCDSAETAVDEGSFKYFRVQFTSTTSKITIEVEDKKGKSFLFTSLTNKNPGPLDPDSAKNTEPVSPRALTVDLTKASSKLLFVAIQGRKESNTFLLNMWDSLFEKDLYDAEVYEDVKVKTEIVTVTSNKKGYEYVYSISHGNENGAFAIDHSNGSITTATTLDRESKASYSLIVIAQDKKQKCHKGRTQVRVKVKDRNDNKPVFVNSNYVLHVREDTPVNQLIFTAKAKDNDEGKNQEVRYRLGKGNDVDFFSIDSITGELRLRKALDYESKKRLSVSLVAADQGNIPQTSMIELQVMVQDVNEPPNFKNECTRNGRGPCLAEVEENKNVSFPVFKFQATDPDKAQNCLLRFRILSSDRKYFSINEVSGQVLTLEKLDREFKETYILKIEVRDCASPPLSSFTELTVKAKDVNDNPPIFSAMRYTSSLEENRKRGTAVMQVKASDADAGRNAELIYTIIAGNVSGSFSINQFGWIITNTVLDRESIDFYNLTVRSSDQGKPSKFADVEVVISVDDVNDNTPFYVGKAVYSVWENSTVNTRIAHIPFMDKDKGLNSKIRCTIIGGQVPNVFRIDSASCSLFVNGDIDRETRSFYNLSIQATDLGNPSKSSTQVIGINVLDDNDNSPEFTEKSYRYTIKENANISTLIAQIKATDKDIGVNKEIEYSIISGDDSPSKFHLQTQTGVLRLIGKLDFGTRHVYDLIVKAEDKGQTRRQTATVVKIVVEDTNDFAPRFFQNFYSVAIAENKTIDSHVIKVTADDKDSGPSGTLTYSIEDGDKDGYFRIGRDTGIIMVQKMLDYERVSFYNLTVGVTDNGKPAMSARTTVSIVVTDINDNHPIFVTSPFMFSVPEDKSYPFFIGNVKATDKDTGMNSQLVYNWLSTGIPFQCNNTGGLILNGTLDYETKKEYILDVMVTDMGVPSLTGKAKVIIKITDVNDNSPVFGSNYCEVMENSKLKSHVCYVKATDADSGLNGEINYGFLVQGGAPFSIEKATGSISVNGPLDREVTPSYRIQIYAEDRGHPTMSSNTSITIIVKDDNDNPPIFMKNKYIFNISEDVSKNTTIGTLIARDKDIGLNAKMLYNIVAGNEEKRFRLDKDTGELTVDDILDREVMEHYVLKVRASDQGVPSLSVEVSVDIMIEDVNDNTPKFTSALYHGTVREDAAIGTRIAQVSATDLDKGDNGRIEYQIVERDKRSTFEIDRLLGFIKTKVALDYETISGYNFTVMAFDKGQPSRNSTAKVNVRIINVDDNAPEFGKVTNASVHEGVQLGSAVVKFNANDKDGGVLTYSIIDGNVDGVFSIDKSLGVLKVNKSLDRESRDFYNLTVAVTDASGHITTANLPVTVLDVNDNKPVFQNTPYRQKLRENIGADVYLMTIRANDSDIGSNQEIEFIIAAGNKGDSFSLSANSGQLKTKKSIDRELYSEFLLEVRATDKGSPSLSTTSIVQISIEDENDNVPRFQNTPSSVQIPENSKNLTTLVHVSAIDPDAGANGTVVYSLRQGTQSALDDFYIDGKSGVVKTRRVLDRETISSYSFIVQATDQGIPPRYMVMTINVTVLDENDNIPIITLPSTIKAVNESDPVGSIVTVFKSNDSDEGRNAMLLYKVVSGNINNAFSLNESTGVLKLSSLLDRELIESYTLKIQVKDEGSPSLRSFRDYTIKISDANDNCPKFDKSLIEGLVSEDIQVGSNVLKISATDADIGTNAQITYSIEGNDARDFTCNATNGQIKSSVALDFETKPLYRFNCQAFDGNCKVTVPCVVRLQNVNDNSPIFTNTSYHATVMEGSGGNRPVLTIKATDKDSFGQISYEIVPKSSSFTIGAQTGEIKTSVLLDRETKDKYVIRVRATDGGQPSKSAFINITIFVDDVNDNAPEFPKDSDVVTVQENKKSGELVYTLNATDKDIGINKEIVYKIVKSPVSDNFLVNPKTGKVTTSVMFDREKVSTYTVHFMAKDKGKPQKESKPFGLTVHIADENDNTPKFKENIVLIIPENKKIGTNVYRLIAEDEDAGRNGDVTFSILSGNVGNAFLLDSRTGVLTINGSLDRENIDSYNISVAASDQGLPPRVNVTSIIIKLTDINDHAPQLNAETLNLTVPENKESGFRFGRVTAVDPDLGNNGKISYSLSSNDKFRIDSESGVLRTLQTLDREERDSYALTLTVSDHGNPPMSTSKIVRVTVLDEDDNCPVFSPMLYNVTIQERLAFGTVVVTVKATDSDQGANGALDYAIKEGDDRGAFTIDPISGQIKVGGEVDREFSSVYHLRIRAGKLDCGLKELNETNVGEGGSQQKRNFTLADVYIHVTDINDNAPVFIDESYNITFQRSHDIHLVNVTAIDKDSGKGGQVKFRLLDTRGVIVAGKEGRRVTVEAFDLGTPSQKANTSIYVINELPCGAMAFSISDTGALSVATLCSFTSLPSALSILKGKSTVLTCEASGNNAPRYHWLKDGSIISSPSKIGALVLRSIQQSDEGEYSCVASNSAGNIQSRSAYIQVLEIPTIVKFSDDIAVSTDNDVTILLIANGDPRPTYQWYKNGRPFHEGVISSRGSLTLKNAIIEDTGNYFVEVKNSVGFIRSRELCLSVFDKGTVIELQMNISNPDPSRTCNYFIPKNFEQTLGAIVNARVSVTKIGPSSFCNVTACNPNPCKNGGKCDITDNGHHCTCTRRWTGISCEEDVKECSGGSTVCHSKTRCIDVQGSYVCNCPNNLTGRKCQYSKSSCTSNSCNDSSLCVLIGNSKPRGYTCIPQSQVFIIAINRGSKQELKDHEVYDIENSLNEIVKTLPQSTEIRRGRRNAPIVLIDFVSCSLRVHSHRLQRNGIVEVSFVLVCPDTLQQAVQGQWQYFCRGILQNEPKAQMCTVQGQAVLVQTPKVNPPSSRFRIEIVITEKTSNRTLGIDESTELLKTSDAASRLRAHGIILEGFNKAYSRKEKKNGQKSPVPIAVGVTLAVFGVILVLMITAVVIKRRKTVKKESQAFVMSERVTERRRSKEDLLAADLVGVKTISSGVDNDAFSKENEEGGYIATNEIFMIQGIGNLAKAARKEVEGMPWFAGTITSEEAETMLLGCRGSGTYMVYETYEDQLILAVLVPPGGPRVRHVPITMSPTKEFSIKIGSMPQYTGRSVMHIIDHYRVTPVIFDASTPEVVLTVAWT